MKILTYDCKTLQGLVEQVCSEFVVVVQDRLVWKQLCCFTVICDAFLRCQCLYGSFLAQKFAER